MKLAAACLLASLLGCRNEPPAPPVTSQGETSTMPSHTASSRSIRELPYESGPPPVRYVSLPVPVRRPGGLRLALFSITMPVANLNLSPEERALEANAVPVPDTVDEFDPVTLELVRTGGWLNQGRAQRFGIPDPAGQRVGRWDDPHWPPVEHRKLLRERIYAALDVLVPLFADESRTWTFEATTAAAEVRDFFPLAAEPGLWPYYRAEGKEFFTWVEKNAPPQRVPSPW